ncbi:primosomal protein N' [Candidatus Saccharibacteria bacterium]|nr:MAG: primosomal protein N' [Candidatus Saccharibacteria bacterium]
MHFYLIAPTVIAHGNHAFLTYHSDNALQEGALVRIEVGKREVSGVVYKSVPKPSFATKPVRRLIEEQPLPSHLLQIAQWMSSYYNTHLSIVQQTILPRGIEKTRRKSEKAHAYPWRDRTNIVLNVSQGDAINTIDQAASGTILLRGVTGSGKTQVYIEAAKRAIQQGKSAIVLVPEIALTSQLVAEFSLHFTNLLVTHSTMTEAERHTIWRQCLTSSTPLIVIGPRSALFSPVPDLGLVVIDECHESSYKQEQAPRYSALRVASKLAQTEGIKTVFGSATPSVVDTYLAQKTSSPMITMLERAQKDAAKPTVHIIDRTDTSAFGTHRFFSRQLLSSIEQGLISKTQSLVFHNRRGSAPLTLCENCGWTAACPNCSMPMTLHTDIHKLLCHVCGQKESTPPHCPVCKEPDIIHKGIGTKLIVSELKKQFPHARIARYDADTHSSEQLHVQYQDLYDGNIDIIVGTQMIAKGLDLPKLRSVGIVQADNGLILPDYQSEERVFQLIHQVIGRVGRSSAATDVIVQTYQPTHPSIQLGIAQDYDAFYDYMIEKRRRTLFPPFTHLLKLTCSYKTEKAAVTACRKIANVIRTSMQDEVRVLGPAPSFYERVGENYRWQLIIKSSHRAALIKTASLVPAQHWQIDLDPANLL